MNITCLCSDPAHPIVADLREWSKKLSAEGHSVSIVFNPSELEGGDILFLVSCGYIVSRLDRGKYKKTLVLHASDLPRGKGWSPYIWSILEGDNRITVSLVEAADAVDSGMIWLKKSFDLEGHELLGEIHTILFQTQLSLMTEGIERFNEIKPYPQVGNAGKYFRRRTPDDSKIDPQLSLAEQFNLLRVADSVRYPSFFEYLGKKYLIKIEKIDDEF